LLVAHGSPDPRHARTMSDLSERLTRRGVPTEVAYLEHDQPSVGRWFATAPRVSLVTVLGLFLSPGMHTRVDLPRVLAQAPEGVRLEPRGALGVGRWLGGVLDDLVATVDATSSTSVVLVTAGSVRTGAQAPFEAFVRWWARQRTGPVELAHSPEAIGRAPREGGVVVPLMIAPGVLADRVEDAATAVGLASTGPLSASDNFTEVLATRLGGEPAHLTRVSDFEPTPPGATGRGSTSCGIPRTASPG
jgi:sirohydrochlorin ferrochelatase